MSSHFGSHRTTDIKPEMLSGVQTGNKTPHDKYNIRGIAHARTNGKDDIFMQCRLVQNFSFMLELGQETCSLTKHTWRWTYSLHAAQPALRHFLLTICYLLSITCILLHAICLFCFETYSYLLNKNCFCLCCTSCNFSAHIAQIILRHNI